MRSSSRRLRFVACVALALPAVLVADTRGVPDWQGSIFTPTRVLGAPMVAEVTVTIPRVMGTSSRTVYQARARYVRDGEGRVRVDQFIVPADGGQSGNAARSFVRLDPDSSSTLLFDHAKRLVTTVSSGMARMFVGGDTAYVVAVGPRDSLTAFGAVRTREYHKLDGDDVIEESLGSRVIAGVRANGSRLTVILAPGAQRNNEPIEIVDERWESPDLQLTVFSRLSDPRVGVSEYTVTSLERVEPDSEAFVMPNGYAEYSITPEHPASWQFWSGPPRRVRR